MDFDTQFDFARYIQSLGGSDVLWAGITINIATSRSSGRPKRRRLTDLFGSLDEYIK